MSSKKRTSEAADLPNKAADRGQETARIAEEDEEMGEFEDRWEDEVEEEIVEGDAEDEGECSRWQECIYLHRDSADCLAVENQL